MIVRLLNGSRNNEFVLKRLPAVVGRGLDATITLEDRWASRHHCEIVRTVEGLEVRDLKSTHGTFVNGKLIENCLLKPGDRLSVGLATFCVEIESEDGEDSLASVQFEGTSAA